MRKEKTVAKKKDYTLERTTLKRTMVNVRKSINARLKQTGNSKLWLAEQIDERPATIYNFLNGKKAIRSDKLEKMLSVLGLEIKTRD